MTRTRLAQLMMITTILEKWLSEGSNRAVTLRHVAGKWRVSLDSTSDMNGESLVDALGQAAQLAAMGGP